MDKISHNLPPNTTTIDEFNMEHFRIRLTARLCTIVACLILYIPRIPSIIADPSFSSDAQLFFILSLPFPLLMPLVITFEYFLYKRLGPGIVKYSSLVDFMLLICFMGDWVMILIGSANKVENTSPVCFKIGALYGFTSFSWRTLMVTLIVQKWLLKIIAPAIGVIIVTVYAIHYNPGGAVFIMLNAGAQLFNIIIIIYCEDKFKWKMVSANIQKEKWMQVNNFILDSLPENIMILDLAGEAKFISEHCKLFIQKFHLPIDTRELFKKICGLKQQPYESSDPLNSSPSSEKGNKYFQDGDSSLNMSKKQTLADLVVNFQVMIKNKQIQERQFLIYNGKLKIEEGQQQDISLEVKISFVQHFENYYIVLIIRDTTKRDLLVTLEETNKYKDQLLASVSHELRAPLNGNINLVESAVNSPQIPEALKESCLIPALRSSKFLLHIINDILDLSQIKEKKLRLVFDSSDLKETLRSTAQLIELQAKKKGIELQLELDPNLSKNFCTDHIRLSQIVLNLLNNAIKFTKEGLVKLTAKPLPESNLVEIRVEDSGIGISQENLKSLFSSFTHIEFEGRQTMNPTGVGLGLNIARNLAALLAPKSRQGIIVSSIPGRGSIFKFILEDKKKSRVGEMNESCEVADESPRLTNSILFSKLQRINNGSTSLIAERSESSALLNSQCFCAKILIVDDNPFNTMAFETVLGSLEITCDSVYSGLACIKSLLNRQSKPCGDNCKQYSVIFMDQEMPEMSGSETTSEIKRLQEEGLLAQGIRVIGCTAHKSKEEVDKFMKSGLEKCIHKPISAALIKDILKRTHRLKS